MIVIKVLRIVREVKGRLVFEFGVRRVYFYDVVNLGVRSVYISGVIGMLNILVDFMYGILFFGIMVYFYV